MSQHGHSVTRKTMKTTHGAVPGGRHFRTSPLVSVITPAYQAERFIGDTVESVLRQSCQEWEYLLVDDCSTDGTTRIIESYANSDERVTLLRNKANIGAAGSRNRGIHAARGRYLAFLDSDDLWEPTKLTEQMQFMTRSNLPLTYTAYKRVDADGQPIGLVEPPARVDYHMMLSSNHMACSTVIVDTATFGKPMFPDLRLRQDHALWLRLLRTADWAHGLGEPLMRYRVRRDSLSANKVRAARYSWQLLVKEERLGFARALYHFGKYAFLATAKRSRRI